MGDGYADPSGWYVGTDSTYCVSNYEIFHPSTIFADSTCEEGDISHQTLDYRVKMKINTAQFNGKPLKKATLKLRVAHSYTWGETAPEIQTVHEVWYKKMDVFPVSYPEAFNYIDPYVGVYLGNIPTMGAGANWGASPPNYGSPVTGGQAWGGTNSAISLYSQPQATWDPQARTLTIDMTELVNQWITGQKPNYGFVLKDGASAGPRSKSLSAYTFESFEAEM
jgi:hypothetical protein